MNPEPIELAQALVELPWWRWMPAMLTDGDPSSGAALPDITDPGTFGALYVLAAEHTPHAVKVLSHPGGDGGYRALVFGGTDGRRWVRTEDGDHPGVALARAIIAAEGA